MPLPIRNRQLLKWYHYDINIMSYPDDGSSESFRKLGFHYIFGQLQTWEIFMDCIRQESYALLYTTILLQNLKY